MSGTCQSVLPLSRTDSYRGAVPRRPTIADVARQAGVSVTTVSHALSGQGRVDQATRDHVRQVSDRLGYVPSRAARNLALGRSDSIGLLLPSLAQMPFDELMRTDWYGRVTVAASREALHQGRALTLLPELTKAGELDAYALEGVIVLDPTDDDPRAEMFRHSRSRIVLLGRGPFDDVFASVIPDVAGGVAQLLDHLHDAGARSIAVVDTDLAWSQGREAVTSYRNWCARKRVRPNVATASVLELKSRESVAAAGQDAAERLLRSADPPDAIVGLLEDFGRGIVAAVRSQGLSVPHDVLVAQDIDGLVAQVNDPPITAIDLNVNALLATAVDMIVRRRDGHIQTVPTSLCPRLSTQRPHVG